MVFASSAWFEESHSPTLPDPSSRGPRLVSRSLKRQMLHGDEGNWQAKATADDELAEKFESYIDANVVLSPTVLAVKRIRRDARRHAPCKDQRRPSSAMSRRRTCMFNDVQLAMELLRSEQSNFPPFTSWRESSAWRQHTVVTTMKEKLWRERRHYYFTSSSSSSSTGTSSSRPGIAEQNAELSFTETEGDAAATKRSRSTKALAWKLVRESSGVREPCQMSVQQLLDCTQLALERSSFDPFAEELQPRPLKQTQQRIWRSGGSMPPAIAKLILQRVTTVVASEFSDSLTLEKAHGVFISVVKKYGPFQSNRQNTTTYLPMPETATSMKHQGSTQHWHRENHLAPWMSRTLLNEHREAAWVSPKRSDRDIAEQFRRRGRAGAMHRVVEFCPGVHLSVPQQTARSVRSLASHWRRFELELSHDAGPVTEQGYMQTDNTQPMFTRSQKVPASSRKWSIVWWFAQMKRIVAQSLVPSHMQQELLAACWFALAEGTRLSPTLTHWNVLEAVARISLQPKFDSCGSRERRQQHQKRTGHLPKRPAQITMGPVLLMGMRRYFLRELSALLLDFLSPPGPIPTGLTSDDDPHGHRPVAPEAAAAAARRLQRTVIVTAHERRALAFASYAEEAMHSAQILRNSFDRWCHSAMGARLEWQIVRACGEQRERAQLSRLWEAWRAILTKRRKRRLEQSRLATTVATQSIVDHDLAMAPIETIAALTPLPRQSYFRAEQEDTPGDFVD
eukprot:INCI15383.1.p1 GENE.INCI15383.1~~INCI15383.1.p1  ORF type:complete len:736 (-),score=93.30 INCI15383.1:1162-3369(-)